MLLQRGISEQAQRCPEAIALAYRESRLSYGELEAQSNRLAAILREHGCERGDRVALLMPKTPTAIMAMLGVLKADAIYVPLDASGPIARSARMLEAADCRFMLASGPVQSTLREALGAALLPRPPLVGWLDQNAPTLDDPRPAFVWDDLARVTERAPVSRNSEADIAHILFTSGSTGTPKGVMITHGNVLQFIG
jgi:acyl-CoA synthetase (AMP-forming)/AMP-acid ligase II